jgi:hypothetical protein
MLALGMLLAAYGVFSKHVRIRNGTLRGRIATDRSQILFVRAMFVLIGAGCVIFGLIDGLHQV